MKNDELYPEFIAYLDSQVNEGRVSRNKFALLKISHSYFQTFRTKFEIDELFRERVIKLRKSEIRDKKIDDIFNEFN